MLWLVYFRDDPRQHPGITPEDLEGLPPSSVAATRREVPWGPLLKRIMPVTLTDFCYGWILWLYLNWLPSFFLHEYKLDLKKSALFAAGVFFAGVVGDTVGGMLSDRILRSTGDVGKARISVIVVGFLGSFCFMLPIVFVHDLLTVAICLSMAFFFAELIVAPIWAIPMDITPEYSGSASGFMNFGFGMAGIISPVVFGCAIDLTGRWDVPFIGSLGRASARRAAGAAMQARRALCRCPRRFHADPEDDLICRRPCGPASFAADVSQLEKEEDHERCR